MEPVGGGRGGLDTRRRGRSGHKGIALASAQTHVVGVDVVPGTRRVAARVATEQRVDTRTESGRQTRTVGRIAHASGDGGTRGTEHAGVFEHEQNGIHGDGGGHETHDHGTGFQDGGGPWWSWTGCGGRRTAKPRERDARGGIEKRPYGPRGGRMDFGVGGRAKRGVLWSPALTQHGRLGAGGTEGLNIRRKVFPGPSL
ncbi:MAG: hypothetical protein CMQ41_14165 [Gammaproteobacteria bacterium]|nr:hypothetical protein [Gammaproteobacteria bacterium]